MRSLLRFISDRFARPKQVATKSLQSSHSRTRQPVSATCWICLEESSTLVRPCACPRAVHERCLARWQLHKAGAPEERWCRFCGEHLPDWRFAMTPDDVMPSASAIMSVVLNGREHRVEVFPGAEGRDRFEAEIRRLFRLDPDDEIDFTFDCVAPAESRGESTRGGLQLEGRRAYEAAFHCASITSALRSSP